MQLCGPNIFVETGRKEKGGASGSGTVIEPIWGAVSKAQRIAS